MIHKVFFMSVIMVLNLISCVQVPVYSPEGNQRTKSRGTSSVPITEGGQVGGKPVSMSELTARPSWRSISNNAEIIEYFEKDVAVSFGVIMEVLRFKTDGTAQRSFEGHRDVDNIWRSLGGNYFKAYKIEDKTLFLSHGEWIDSTAVLSYENLQPIRDKKGSLLGFECDTDLGHRIFRYSNKY